ncbi:hypothetical protein BD626DRAFT_584193 [Schizophyllum amplum]|uniref:Uncharacterized protein n=1 Tax=Schizophyllum amplum TaxID=97359 RepID=A0A550CAV9_9AGAR|nr:hypothetical protein BD626DRAFT_584193 [Auriculariopsis ampla]
MLALRRRLLWQTRHTVAEAAYSGKRGVQWRKRRTVAEAAYSGRRGVQWQARRTVSKTLGASYQREQGAGERRGVSRGDLSDSRGTWAIHAGLERLTPGLERMRAGLRSYETPGERPQIRSADLDDERNLELGGLGAVEWPGAGRPLFGIVGSLAVERGALGSVVVMVVGGGMHERGRAKNEKDVHAPATIRRGRGENERKA